MDSLQALFQQTVQVKKKTSLCLDHHVFLDKNLYEQSKKNIEEHIKQSINQIQSIELKCSGGASFKPEKVMERFIQCLTSVMTFHNLRTIKLKITDFDLNHLKNTIPKSPAILKKICDIIYQSSKLQNLITLEIRTSHLRGCTIQNFKQLLMLGFSLEAQNLQNLTLQFGSWCFGQPIQDEDHNHFYNQQPSLETLISSIKQSKPGNEETYLKTMRFFRLQISTWYYKPQEYKKFIGAISSSNYVDKQKIQSAEGYVHSEIVQLVKGFINHFMPILHTMEIDLRNWHPKFQMGSLAKQLANIKKEKVKHVKVMNAESKQEKTMGVPKEKVPMFNLLVQQKIINSLPKQSQKPFSMHIAV